jgi:endonuclease YncB( thermonuclease family)
MPRRLASLTLVLLALLLPGAAGAAVLDGPALVQDDGTLSVAGRTVRLYGIWIPQFGRTCSTTIRPTRCAPRAVLLLDYKVTGFVRCEEVQRLPDGSVEAFCSIRARRLFDPREDLGAWMVQNGLAFARPDAPAEYVLLERLAESQEQGFWGPNIFNVK